MKFKNSLKTTERVLVRMAGKNQLDPLWLALSKLRRGKLEDSINICNDILSNNPGDQVSDRPLPDYPL